MAAEAFRRLWLAAGLSNLGDGIGLIAIPLLAATLTRDPVLVGGVTAVAFLPYLLFGIPIGVLVDRVERRRAMLVANIARAALLAVLCAGILTGAVTIWWVYLLAFAFASFECLYDNAAEGAVPQLVPADRLDGANARLQGTVQIANNFVGGPLGAILFAVAAALPFGIQSAGHLVAAVLVSGLPRLSPPRPPRAGARDRARGLACVRADAREGLGWLFRNRALRGLALISAGMAFCNQLAMATLVLFALDVLDVPAAAFGLFAMTAAVGAVLGAIAAPSLARRFGRTNVMIVGTLVQPIAIVATGLAPGAAVAALTFLVYAGLVGLWNVLSISLRQQLIPSHLFGRVHGAWRTIVWGALPLGSWIGGVIAEAAGLRAPWIVGAVLFAVVAVLGVTTLREVGRLTSAGQASDAGAGGDEVVAGQSPAVVAGIDEPALSNIGSSASP